MRFRMRGGFSSNRSPFATMPTPRLLRERMGRTRKRACEQDPPRPERVLNENNSGPREGTLLNRHPSVSPRHPPCLLVLRTRMRPNEACPPRATVPRSPSRPPVGALRFKGYRTLPDGAAPSASSSAGGGTDDSTGTCIDFSEVRRRNTPLNDAGLGDRVEDADQARRRRSSKRTTPSTTTSARSPAPRAPHRAQLTSAARHRAARARQDAARFLPRARLRAHRLGRRRDERLGPPSPAPRERRQPRLRAVPGEPTSRTTGPTPRPSRSAITSSRTSSGRASPATCSCSPRRRAGPPATRRPTSRPYWGCDQSSRRHGARRSQNGTLHRGATSSRASTSRRSPTFCRRGRLEVLRDELLRPARDLVDVRRHPTRSADGPALGTNVVNATTFDSDVAAGTLPAVSWLVDQDLADEHPGVGGVCAGENWTVGHINGIMKSPLLGRHGHPLHDGRLRRLVRPRQAAARSTGAIRSMPYGLGFRLPLLVISPFAKPGFIFSEQSRAGEHPAVHRAGVRRDPDADALDPAAQDKQANDLFGRLRFQPDAAAAARSEPADLPAVVAISTVNAPASTGSC